MDKDTMNTNQKEKEMKKVEILQDEIQNVIFRTNDSAVLERIYKFAVEEISK